jgi:hypothetical protein
VESPYRPLSIFHYLIRIYRFFAKTGRAGGRKGVVAVGHDGDALVVVCVHDEDVVQEMLISQKWQELGGSGPGH